MENNAVVTENKKVKEPKTPKQKVFFALKIVGNVIFYGVLIVLFLWSIMNINGGARNQGFPNIFGRGFLNVSTGSMSHENLVNDIYKLYPEYKDYEIQGINAGDLITSKVLNDEDRKNLKIGDVCTFYDSSLNALNTHRLVYITYNTDGSVAIYTFQGDVSVASYGKYDPVKDPVNAMNLLGRGEIQQFSGDNIKNIKGVTTGVTAGGGKVLQNLQDNWLWYFVFPVVILLLVEVFLVVRNIMILRGEKNKVELATEKDAILADEKERLRQELLAELRAQGLAPAEAPKEEVKEDVAPAVAPVVTESEPQEEIKTVAEEEKVEEPVQETTTAAVVEEAPQEVETDEVVEEATTEAPVEEVKEEETPEEVVEPETEETKEETPVEETPQEEVAQEEVQEEPVQEIEVENKEEVVEEPKAEAEPTEEVAETEVKEEAPKKAPAKKKTTSTTGAKKTTTKKATADKPKTTTKTATKKTTTKKETK